MQTLTLELGAVPFVSVHALHVPLTVNRPLSGTCISTILKISKLFKLTRTINLIIPWYNFDTGTSRAQASDLVVLYTTVHRHDLNISICIVDGRFFDWHFNYQILDIGIHHLDGSRICAIYNDLKISNFNVHKYIWHLLIIIRRKMYCLIILIFMHLDYIVANFFAPIHSGAHVCSWYITKKWV